MRKSTVMSIIVTFALITGILAGCDNAPRMSAASEGNGAKGNEKQEPVPSLTGAEMSKNYRVSRFIDKEAQVLCYSTFSHGDSSSGALSCVPLTMTTLRGQAGK